MLEVGVMLNNLEPDRLKAFAIARQQGFRIVHTSALAEAWLSGQRRAEYIAAARASGLAIAAMFVGFDGQSYADLPTIARTVGLVQPATQQHRIEVACTYCALAEELACPALAAHIGFIPGSRDHAEYGPLVRAVQMIADRCAAHGKTFHLETGQESAELLIQFLEDVRRANVGVNFDPANLIVYGTDDPIHAVELLAPYLRGVHCKDAVGSQSPGTLGTEVQLGQGEVSFPGLLRRIYGLGYRGPLVIEREHSPDVLQDVEAARCYLQSLLTSLA